MDRLKRYGINLFIAFDQLANTLFGGDPDETISSRCGKRIRAGRRWCPVCRALCWALNLVDAGHCRDAIEKDEGRWAVYPDGEG